MFYLLRDFNDRSSVKGNRVFDFFPQIIKAPFAKIYCMAQNSYEFFLVNLIIFLKFGLEEV